MIMIKDKDQSNFSDKTSFHITNKYLSTIFIIFIVFGSLWFSYLDGADDGQIEIEKAGYLVMLTAYVVLWLSERTRED